VTAFNLDVLVLLLAAFVSGLAIGFWLRRPSRNRTPGGAAGVVRDAPVAKAMPATRGAQASAVEVSPAKSLLAKPAPADPLRRETLPKEPSSKELLPKEPLSKEPLSKEPHSKEPHSKQPFSKEPMAGEPAPPRREEAALPARQREQLADLFGHFLKVSADTVPEPAPSPPAAPRRASAAAVREPHPGTRPPALEAPEGGTADDLKLLKGIGPQNEQRLNALGIFHFRQIAAWTPEEAAWVGSSLAFPGRIEREDWIGQAQAWVAAAQGGGTPTDEA